MPRIDLTFNPTAPIATELVAACDALVGRIPAELPSTNATDLALLRRVARTHFVSILREYRNRQAAGGVTQPGPADWPD